MSVVRELEKVRKSGRGVLRPASVVEFAKNPKTTLHSKFEWDDIAAGHQYRLEQARKIIRITVMVTESDKTPFRAYYSLRNDRNNEDGGYRGIVDILSSKQMTQQLLEEALEDAKVFKLKYARLQALVPLFDAIDATVKKLSRKK